jgi:hypothetical protein
MAKTHGRAGQVLCAIFEPMKQILNVGGSLRVFGNYQNRIHGISEAGLVFKYDVNCSSRTQISVAYQMLVVVFITMGLREGTKYSISKGDDDQQPILFTLKPDLGAFSCLGAEAEGMAEEAEEAEGGGRRKAEGGRSRRG